MNIWTILILPIYENRIYFHFLHLLQLISAMFCSFPCKYLSPHWLNLFLIVLFFLMLPSMKLFSWFTLLTDGWVTFELEKLEVYRPWKNKYFKFNYISSAVISPVCVCARRHGSKNVMALRNHIDNFMNKR